MPYQNNGIQTRHLNSHSKKDKNCQFATNYDNVDKDDASESLGKTIH